MGLANRAFDQSVLPRQQRTGVSWSRSCASSCNRRRAAHDEDDQTSTRLSKHLCLDRHSGASSRCQYLRRCRSTSIGGFRAGHARRCSTTRGHPHVSTHPMLRPRASTSIRSCSNHFSSTCSIVRAHRLRGRRGLAAQLFVLMRRGALPGRTLKTSITEALKTWRKRNAAAPRRKAAGLRHRICCTVVGTARRSCFWRTRAWTSADAVSSQLRKPASSPIVPRQQIL